MAAAAVSPTGLTILHEPKNSVPDTDIIFVHGLQGHPQKTWTYNSTSDPLSFWKNTLRIPTSAKNLQPNSDDARAVFWPQDLLPRECPTTRIMTFGYDTKVTKKYDAVDQGNIFTHAKDLLYGLDRTRRSGRRVIFVAHSLGGIIVKEVLRRSECSDEDRVRDILESTVAVVFLGTPHRGSQGLASTADAVRRVAQAVLMVDTNAKILRSLGVDGPELDLCQASFITQWRTRNFQVKTFQEAKGVMGLTLGQLNDKVVPDTSSSLGDPREHAESIPANHKGMTKFWGRDDPGYQKVGFELARLAASRNYESECLRALSFADMKSREAAIKPPIAQTGSWLFSLDAYTDWVNRTNLESTQGWLCLKGKPGSGKSTLMKEAARQATKCWPRPIVAAFFFSGQGSELERSPLGLIRSLILQIWEQDEAFKELVVTHYRNHSRHSTTKWNSEVEELQEVLAAGLLERHRRVMLFIDALDECNQNSTRVITHYLRTLSDRVFAAGKMLDVCLSSRHYPAIFIPRCPEIAIEKGNEVDIAQYININLSYGMTSQDEMVDRLRALLLRKSSGVFLWTVLVVDMILKDLDAGKVEEEIEETLEAVPEDLVALFTDILSTLTTKEREDSLVLVQWVLLSPRPLQAADIRIIRILGVEITQSLPETMVKFQRPGNLSADWDEDAGRVERNVRTLSRGLMEISVSKVRFIHESVRQFFLQEGSAVFGTPTFIPLGHCMIIRSCLQGLCLLESLTSKQSSKAHTLQWIPVYTERFALYHAIEARHDVELPSQLLHLVREVVRVVASRGKVQDITALSHTGAVEFARQSGHSTLLVKTSKAKLFDSHLFSLAVSGATLCSDALRRQDGLALSAKHSIGDSLVCLIAPNSTGWDDEYLDVSHLKHGDTSDRESCSILLSQMAQYQERQRKADIHRLLRTGANVNMADSEGNTALHLAVWKGMWAVAEELLQHHADVNISNEYRMTPLHLACLYGRFFIAERLIERGADVNIRGYDSYTPLHTAAEASDLFLTRRLIEAGANVNAVDDFGKTPLHLAMQYGADFSIIDLLCQCGADIHAKDQVSLTPLEIAVDLERALHGQNPRTCWSGSSTNFEKMLASRASHREPTVSGSPFAPPPHRYDIDN